MIRGCVQYENNLLGFVRMTREELRSIRRDMHYSMADFGVLLGIPKTTLQRYEDGSAAIPDELAQKVVVAQRKDRDFMESVRVETREWVNRMFPHGIPADYK